MDEKDSKPNEWHLDRRFSITHFITTAMLIAALFRWGGALESENIVQNTRLDTLEQMQRQQMLTIQREMEKQSNSILREMTQLRNSIDSLGDKVERVNREKRDKD